MGSVKEHNGKVVDGNPIEFIPRKYTRTEYLLIDSIELIDTVPFDAERSAFSPRADEISARYVQARIKARWGPPTKEGPPTDGVTLHLLVDAVNAPQVGAVLKVTIEELTVEEMYVEK